MRAPKPSAPKPRVLRQQLSVQLLEAPAVGFEAVEERIGDVLGRPVAADQEVGPKAPVSAAGPLEVTHPIAVPVLVVEDDRRAVGCPGRVLVADREHPLTVHLGRDRSGVGVWPGSGWRPARTRSRRAAARTAAPVDRDRLVPGAGQVVTAWILEDRRNVLGRPDLSALDVAEQREPGDVIVVVVRGDDRLDASTPRSRFSASIDQGSGRRAVRSVIGTSPVDTS